METKRENYGMKDVKEKVEQTKKKKWSREGEREGRGEQKGEKDEQS